MWIGSHQYRFHKWHIRLKTCPSSVGHWFIVWWDWECIGYLVSLHISLEPMCIFELTTHRHSWWFPICCYSRVYKRRSLLRQGNPNWWVKCSKSVCVHDISSVDVRFLQRSIIAKCRNSTSIWVAYNWIAISLLESCATFNERLPNSLYYTHSAFLMERVFLICQSWLIHEMPLDLDKAQVFQSNIESFNSGCKVQNASIVWVLGALWQLNSNGAFCNAWS